MAHNEARSEMTEEALAQADPVYDEDEAEKEEPKPQPPVERRTRGYRSRSPVPRSSRRARTPPVKSSASRSRSRRRRHRPLPFLRRERRRRTPSPSPAPMSFRRGRLVVVAFDQHQDGQEADWKQVFRRHNFLVYDHKYPFRMAAETVLRQNKHYQQSSRYRHRPTGDLTDRMYHETVRLFGSQFETDYFVDWVENLSSPDRKQAIVVFGVDRTSNHLRSNLRRMGGMVVGPPLSDSDYIIHTTRDLEKFVKDL